MADDTEEDIDKLKSAESAIIEEEGRKRKKRESQEEQKQVRQPARAQYDEHVRTHTIAKIVSPARKTEENK